MVHGSLTKGILAYALPVALTGMLQAFFNAADMAVVGQFVGKEAMAAVGATSPVINLLINFFLGMSVGTGIILAQRAGSGDGEGVSKTVHTSVVFAVVGGVGIAAIGIIISAPLLSIMSLPEEVFPLSLVYMRILFAAEPAMMLCNFIATILRNHGDSATPMVTLSLTGALNVGLNVLFVRAFGMSVEGVALATLISYLICAVSMLVILMRREGDIRLVPRKLKIDPGTLKNIMYIGLPSGVQSMVFQFANIYLQSAINSLGTTAMAASAAASHPEGIVYYVVQGFGYACAAFVGQNNGAGDHRRCAAALRRCLLLDFIIAGGLSVLAALFRNEIMWLFNPDPEVIRLACVRFLLLLLGYMFCIAYEVFSGYLRGYSKPIVPTIISIVCICVIRISWVAFYFPSHRDFFSLMVVFPISLGMAALALAVASLVFAAERRKRERA